MDRKDNSGDLSFKDSKVKLENTFENEDGGS